MINYTAGVLLYDIMKAFLGVLVVYWGLDVNMGYGIGAYREMHILSDVIVQLFWLGVGFKHYGSS